jgi:N-acetylneuraminic acid mutarotase
VRAFDVAAGEWGEAPALPRALHHANAAVVDGAVFVLGALEPDFGALGLALRWDPGEPGWTEIEPLPPGSERGAAAVGVIAGKVYLAGGYRGGAIADVVAYDPALDAWTTDHAPLPAPRDHLTGQAVGDALYAIGGRAGGITGVEADVVAYDPAADAGTARAAMPTARGGMASGVVGVAIVVVGGEGNVDAPSGVFDAVELYNPVADAWTELDPMPRPRHGMGAVGVDGVLYVPGGADVQGFGAVATHESFAP